MLALKKWEPFSELSTLHKEMDELFKRTFGSIVPSFFKGEWYPNVESFIKGNTLWIKADLPGLDPKDVAISVAGSTLTIKGERKEEKKEEEKGEYFFRETSYGAFERTITLPEGVDTDKVHASYKNGVIEVTMPVKEAARPKKVTIEVEAAGKKAA